MRKSYRVLRRIRTQAIRTIHLMTLCLGVLQGDAPWTTPSTIQVLRAYQAEKDHTGIPSWTLALSWQGTDLVIYAGTERSIAILEAILRRKAQP